MEDAKAIVRSYWDWRSRTYDLSPGHVASSAAEVEAWKRLLKKHLGPAETGKKVLDVGVGTGFLSMMLCEMGYDVVGIDLSSEMLSIARKKAEGLGHKIRLEQADAEALPFVDCTFGAVVNRAVLWTIPDPGRAISEWKRVLRPGGTLCFFLHGPHRKDRSLHEIAGRQISNISILAMEKRNPWISLRDRVDLPLGGGADPSRVKDLLREAGFAEICCEPMTDIGHLKEEKTPWYPKPGGVQYAYSCNKP